jgi:2-keto-3-deoxy-L-rhamnonate aldolase RhmA
MIETAEGVKRIDDIIRVPGIGGIFVGASDLGVSLGVGPPNNGVNAPETEAAVQTVLLACKRSKVACAYPVLGGAAELERRRSEGFRVLLVAGQPPPRR